MKKTITLKNLKRIVTESISIEDRAELFKEFQTRFFDDLIGNTNIDNSLLGKLIVNQLGGKWEAYESDAGPMLALNVKGYGMGNWNAFNKDGRAEAKGISIDEYSRYIQEMNGDFFNNWDATFRKKFNIDLYSAGRSSGHWGFKMRDLIYKVFEPKVAEIQKLFDEMTKNATEEELMFPDDLVYAAMNLIDYYEDFDKYVKFWDGFVDTLNEFESDVANTSSRMESQEFNDEVFNDFVE